MDIFEYATVNLRFEEHKSDKMKARGFLDITTYESDGKTPGKPNRKTVSLGTFDRTTHCEVVEHHPWGLDTVFTWHPVRTGQNYPMLVMTPYLAMLGKQGWGVIEYKTNNDPAFGQALLKRKVQNKK